MKQAITVITLVIIFGCSEASEISKTVEKQRTLLPKRVNSFITWTDIQVAEKEIQNVYLVNEKELALPLSAALLELKTSGKANILRSINSNASTRGIIHKGYTFRYIYRDLQGETLYVLVVTKDDLY